MSQEKSPELGVLQIVHKRLELIRPNPSNARRHTKKQIVKLCSAIKAHGFIGPIVIDELNVILAGHGRYQAAVRLQLDTVPCVQVTHLSDAQKIAFAIADNKLSDLSEFDPDALRAQLTELIKVDFNLEQTCFDTGEIDLLFEVPQATAADPADEFAEPDLSGPAVSRRGDVWVLGAHRLACGDALDEAAYARLLDGELAQMAFTDPPYNVEVDGHVSGLGRVKHREFAMASGEMSKAEFREFLSRVMTLMARFSSDGSIHFVCIDWRHINDLVEAGDKVFTELKNICAWVKPNGGMGSLYRSQHEFVCVFKRGKAAHINNVELGKNGRYRTNVWNYAGANSFGRNRMADLEAHPTVKPVGLVADAIRDCSKRGGLILDPFCGSGTTILACERTGRRAAAIEIDPVYVDTAIRRWQSLTGKVATLGVDGPSFNQVAAERLADVSCDEEDAA